MIANQVKKISRENLSGAKTLGHAVVIGGGIAGLSAAQILTGLEVDEAGRRVAGVRLRQRHAPGSTEILLAADLVVDASGRSSGASRWLESLGYETPGEETVNAFTGYASRIYRRPAEFAAGWKSLYIRPSVSESRRGGIMLPLEGNRWHVTLIGMAQDYPPTGEDAFLNFARSLPTQTLYNVIKDAEPLTNISGYRNTANCVRHYDRLPRYLEGLLVTGDAVYMLNPVYALGMTAAAMGSLALERSLKEQLRRNPSDDLSGLARRFQKRLSQVVDQLWQMATTEDLFWPGTEVKEDFMPVQSGTPVREFKAVPLMA